MKDRVLIGGQKMGFGVEASVDCGSPVESYYSSWLEKNSKYIWNESKIMFLGMTE